MFPFKPLFVGPLISGTTHHGHPFKCRMSNLGCRMSHVGCRISDVGCQISDVGCRMSDLGCQMSNLGCRVSDVRSRMSDVGCRISDVGCRMSNLGCRMSDVESRMSNVGCRMSDGTYNLPYDCTKYPKTMTAHKTEILNMLPYCKILCSDWLPVCPGWASFALEKINFPAFTKFRLRLHGTL